MPSLRPAPEGYVAEVYADLHGPTGVHLTVYSLKASDPQAEGELLASAADMIDQAMKSADPLICSLLVSCSRQAKEALRSWSEMLAAIPAIEGERSPTWLRRQERALVRMLQPSRTAMHQAVLSARNGGVYPMFRNALVEKNDEVLVAFKADTGETVGVLSFDDNGPKAQRNGGTVVAALKGEVDDEPVAVASFVSQPDDEPPMTPGL